MGEGNACTHRRGKLPDDLMEAAAATYDELYGEYVPGPDGKPTRVVPATFQIIYLIGWTPAASQPKPLARGAATSSLADGLATMKSTDLEEATTPEAFSLKDIARETGGVIGRVSISDAEDDG
eukprot:SAG31_NODE_2245_length_6101_cov_1.381539_2_plen_123_part_00